MEHNKDCHMFSCKNRTKDHIYMDFHRCTCTIKPSQDKTVEKTINWIPMPCVKCHKVTKVPEHSLYCMECNSDPVEEFEKEERRINYEI